MGFRFFVILDAVNNLIVNYLQDHDPRNAKAVVTF
jgi:hypothetical protein